MYVKPKKQLGQHFLTDMGIARRIADTLPDAGPYKVLEIGPGTGVLTQFLLQRNPIDLRVIEIDTESVAYLNQNFEALAGKIIAISSQIFFKALEHKDQIPFISGMLQKEVAERIASKPGKKAYGILSVLLQAYYDIEYLFTVPPSVFNPPPKVQSAVIKMTRNNTEHLPCNEVLFKNVVKTTFNQRRKTIRNSIKPLLGGDFDKAGTPLLDKRPEQLSVAEFVELTTWVESQM